MGHGSNLGLVEKSSASNFPELVESFFKLPGILNVSREYFHAQEKAKRDKLKRTSFLTPCDFNPGTTQRKVDQAKSIVLIHVDIDDKTQAAPLVENPEFVYEQLHPFNFVFYQTANSTPEAPRGRIIVEADNLDLENYAQAVKTISTMVGLSQVTPESLRVHLPMFMPTSFKGDDPEKHHPLVSYRDDGLPFAEGHITGADLPIASSSKKKTAYADSIEFLKAPVEEVDFEEAESMLSHLEPDCSYDEWLYACLALRHQFCATEEDEQRAYKLFDEWSSKGSKYQGSEDTEAKWKSCNPHAESRAPITIRSLMKVAHDAGWDSTDVVQKCFETTEKWIQDCESARELIHKGIQKIALTPLQSGTEEELLLNKVLARMKKLGQKASLASLRNELRKAKSLINFRDKDKKENIPKWAKGFVYVGDTNEFYRRSVGQRLGPEAFDNTFGRQIMEESSNGTKPDERPRDICLFKNPIPEAHAFVYDPRKPDESVIRKGGLKYANTYVRNFPDANMDRLEEAKSIIEEHCSEVISEPEYQKVFLDYLAYMVQRPGQKIRWSPLIQGEHGCGKTTFSDLMGVVLGDGHTKIVEPQTLIKSQFNDWAEGSQLVTFEEIRVVGQSRHEVMNKLKPLISNSKAPIHPKGEKARTIDNITNYIALTNFHDAAALSEGDRRWFVISSPCQTKEDVRRLNAKKDGKYFDLVYEQIEKNPGGCRAYFETRKISPNFKPNGHAPRTKYFDEMLEITESDDKSQLSNVFNDKNLPLCNKIIVCVSTLCQLFELEGQELRPQKAAALLKNVGFTKRGRLTTMDNVKRTIYASRCYTGNATEDVELLLQEVIGPEDLTFLYGN